MNTDRFNELLNGPLRHPLPMFTITRLALALKAVVDATARCPAVDHSQPSPASFTKTEAP